VKRLGVRCGEPRAGRRRYHRALDLELKLAPAAIAVVVLLTDSPLLVCANCSRIARHVVVRAGS